MSKIVELNAEEVTVVTGGGFMNLVRSIFVAGDPPPSSEIFNGVKG